MFKCLIVCCFTYNADTTYSKAFAGRSTQKMFSKPKIMIKRESTVASSPRDKDTMSFWYDNTVKSNPFAIEESGALNFYDLRK